MVPRADAIAAAKRFAPPLIVIAAIDRRGARLRRINPLAIRYAKRAGLELEEVYPGGTVILRALAPHAFAAAVIPRPAFGVEAAGVGSGVGVAGVAVADVSRRSGWGWTAAGAALGAMAGGPWGAALGGGLGALIGGGR
jgi:hypothetical protein